MPTQDQVQEIIDTVQRRLDEVADQRHSHLKVRREDSKLDDDWLYVCLTPTRSGESASDHANLMSDIEKELRKEGTENVLLVPAIAD